jgi:antitoxin component YwqK of YwqJK toxin-antitoxin module
MDDIYDKYSNIGLLPDITKMVVGYLVEEIKTDTESYILFDGKKHGLEEHWRLNGQLSHSCNYLDGKKHGLEKWWHTDGRPMFRHNWE